MQDLKITLVQCSQSWEDKKQNVIHIESLLEHILDTDLILLPEMFHTAFSMNAQLLAEEWNHSEAIETLKRWAKTKQAAIYTSLIIKEKECFYNRGVFVFPNGELQIYDKRKLFTLAKEDETYTAGNKQQIVNYLGWNINLQICYDLRFPELARNKWLGEKAAYDLILYVANWPERRSTHWKHLLPARAIENQSFLAGLNRVGEDGKGLTYSGDSAVISPLGNYLLKAKANEEEVIQTTLSYSELETIRTQLNFLKDA